MLAIMQKRSFLNMCRVDLEPRTGVKNRLSGSRFEGQGGRGTEVEELFSFIAEIGGDLG